MGLERRGNGYYYYKKEREGDKVVSHYRGSGLANLFSMLDELDDDCKENERYEKQLERERAEKFEAELAEIEAAFSDVITAYFLINGYHQTASREWRKKRDGGK